MRWYRASLQLKWNDSRWMRMMTRKLSISTSSAVCRIPTIRTRWLYWRHRGVRGLRCKDSVLSRSPQLFRRTLLLLTSPRVKVILPGRRSNRLASRNLKSHKVSLKKKKYQSSEPPLPGKSRLTHWPACSTSKKGTPKRRN